MIPLNDNEILNNLLTDTVKQVDKVINTLFELSIEDNARNSYLGKVGRASGLLKEVQSMIHEKQPELKPSPPSDYVKDDDISDEERNLINKLHTEDISIIERCILSNVSEQFRKVARVVGDVSEELKNSYPEITYLFYSERIRSMVESGKLVSQGDLHIMRYSEIKKSR